MTPQQLNLAFRLLALMVLLGLLVFVVATDRSDTIALAILGILGGAVALDQNARNKGGDET